VKVYMPPFVVTMRVTSANTTTLADVEGHVSLSIFDHFIRLALKHPLDRQGRVMIITHPTRSEMSSLTPPLLV